MLLVYTAIWSYQYYFIRFPQVKELFQHLDVGPKINSQVCGFDARRYPPCTTPLRCRLRLQHLPVTWQVCIVNLRTFDDKVVLAPAGPQPSLLSITVYRATLDVAGVEGTLPGRSSGLQHQQFLRRAHSLAFAVDPRTPHPF